jgi:hypothetical protein
MSDYSTAKTMRVPLTGDKIIALMHRDGLIVVEVTVIPWESGEDDERIEQGLRVLKADAEKNGDSVRWKYKGKPIPLDPSWWPAEVPVLKPKE